jgi:hypothetical protein
MAVRLVGRALARTTTQPWRERPGTACRHWWGISLRGLPQQVGRLDAKRSARDHHPPSARQAVWLLLRPLDALTVRERHMWQWVLAAAAAVDPQRRPGFHGRCPASVCSTDE